MLDLRATLLLDPAARTHRRAWAHTEASGSLPGCPELPRPAPGRCEEQIGEGLQSWLKAPLGSFRQVLWTHPPTLPPGPLRGHHLGPPGGAERQFQSPWALITLDLGWGREVGVEVAGRSPPFPPSPSVSGSRQPAPPEPTARLLAVSGKQQP